MVEEINLQVQSVIAVLSRPAIKRRWAEISLLSVRLLGYPVLLFIFLPAGKAAAFIGIQAAVTGLYLGAAFAASHIGMPILPHDSRIDFFRRQVLTSRNVAGGRIAGWAMGGLNWQIEHHLFPSMPRPNLRLSVPLVRELLRRETGPLRSADDRRGVGDRGAASQPGGSCFEGCVPLPDGLNALTSTPGRRSPASPTTTERRAKCLRASQSMARPSSIPPPRSPRPSR